MDGDDEFERLFQEAHRAEEGSQAADDGEAEPEEIDGARPVLNADYSTLKQAWVNETVRQSVLLVRALC
jgi:hypothetical protein